MANVLRFCAVFLVLIAPVMSAFSQTPVRYLAKKKLFVLASAHSTYVFGVNERGELQHLYWGPRLWRDEELHAAHSPGTPIEISTTAADQEYTGWGNGLFFEPCLKITFPDGNRDLVLHYVGHQIAGNMLTVTLKDIERAVFVHLHYTMDSATGILRRDAVIENRTGGPITLESAQSATWYPPAGDQYRLRYLTGKWAGEWHLNEELVHPGSRVLQSRTGITGFDANPWFALDHPGTHDPEHGSVWFGALGWSGNWRINVEETPAGQVRVTGGYNPFDFGYHLAAGKSLTTPPFYAGYTDSGMDGASRLLHRFELAKILPQSSAHRPRPILYNSWYATGLEVNVANQEALAKKAAAIGVERFVIDDGWFRAPHTARTGVGDWIVNSQKFPQGLKPLIAYVKSLGMDFGIWVEPEMVNPDSELYRKHPDWVLNFPGRPRTQRSDLLVLNLARDDVKEYTFQWLDRLVTDNDITFLKVDHNRDFSEPGWPQVPPDEQKNLWVLYTKNLYEIFDRLRQKHPKLEIETCAGGGARVDLGILRRTDEAWPSDNTDALDRLIIQDGFTYAYTPHVMEDWVTDVPNGVDGRTVPLKFNFLVAMEGSLGIGADLDRWTPEQLATAKRMVSYYKTVRDTVENGDLYRLASMRNGGNFAASEYVSGDGSQVVLFAFLHSQKFGNALPPLRLRGLDGQALYRIHRIDNKLVEPNTMLSGDYLMHHGLSLRLTGDYDSTSLRLEKVSDAR